MDIKPSESLSFEQIFLRSPKVREIVLNNTSDLKAKFSIREQEETSKRVAVFSVMPPKGEIEPHDKRELTVRLVAEQTGSINISMFLYVSSAISEKCIIITAEVLGPQVSVNHKELEFREVCVLKPLKEKITITNNSEIPANYTAFTREKNSVFSVEAAYWCTSARE